MVEESNKRTTHKDCVAPLRFDASPQRVLHSTILQSMFHNQTTIESVLFGTAEYNLCHSFLMKLNEM